MANPYGIEGRTLAYWGVIPELVGSWLFPLFLLLPGQRQSSFRLQPTHVYHSPQSRGVHQQTTGEPNGPVSKSKPISGASVKALRQRSHWSVRPLNVSLVGYWNPQVSKKPPVILTAHCFLFWILKQLQPGFFIWEESSLWPLREKHCSERFVTWGSLWSCLFYHAVSSMYLIRIQWPRYS